ncbi:MAG: 16S rRNA (guanine(527)-N(7))-methyltransferase RsmG [Chloroflexi bacterium 13_1_40CM_4_68_4]|nr:MAG: 16S rRNA (guanine(527)-N(7))-methyltransferase RsmG [Chloroflexi bacterium 13_1_40CM_4_68_4]
MKEHPAVAQLDLLADCGIRLDATQLQRFERYSALLRERNEAVNLTAIVDPAEIATKHFLDSLTLLLARPPAPGARLIDVGTGAGFPGVPLAIARSDLRVTLVESVGKKVRFLEELIAALGLANVALVHGRAEDVGREPAHRERHDVAVARALPVLATNVELLLPLCRVGGEAVAYKGRIEAELAAGDRAARALGGEIARVVTMAELSLADVLPGRCLVIAAKRRPTPARYPRTAAELKRAAW